MPTIANKARERLAAGQLSLGMALRQARTVDIGRVLAACGFDFAFIDMEHNTMGIDTAAQIAVACQDAGVTPLVRVPGYEHYHATRAGRRGDGHRVPPCGQRRAGAPARRTASTRRWATAPSPAPWRNWIPAVAKAESTEP